MAEFLFMNIDNPIQLSNSKARKLARSHISRRQHKQKRNALLHALALKGVGLQTTGRSDGTIESQYDGWTLLSSTSDSSDPARTDTRKAGRKTTAEHLTTCDPGLVHMRLTGGLLDCDDTTCTPTTSNLGDSRPIFHSHLGNPTESIVDCEQSVSVVSQPHRTGGCSTVLEIERDLEEKTFLSWEGTIEEDAERATRLPNHLTARPGLSCPYGLTCHVTKHISVSRVHYSHDDLGKELQDFAGKLGIDITAMLVYSHHSFKPAQYKR
jgi:hypothetical protein